MPPSAGDLGFNGWSQGLGLRARNPPASEDWQAVKSLRAQTNNRLERDLHGNSHLLCRQLARCGLDRRGRSRWRCAKCSGSANGAQPTTVHRRFPTVSELRLRWDWHRRCALHGQRVACAGLRRVKQFEKNSGHGHREQATRSRLRRALAKLV